MTYDLNDTIAAIASAPGGAARGIVRLSGPGVRDCLSGLFIPSAAGPWRPKNHAAVFSGSLRPRELNSPLPCDLYFWPDARSYTRQPQAEIHTLGSPPLLEIALRSVCARGARVAEPGEFSLRAFLGGRLDLTQAEAVLGAIDAAGERQFDVALGQLAGGISQPMTRLRDSLLDLLAELEAGLDFVEEDIQFISPEELDRRLCEAATEIQRLAGRMTSRGQSQERVRVALLGWPNVGKSSLFNALTGRDNALVSSASGTTRDYLTAEMEVHGIQFELIDTAGVEPPQKDSRPSSIAAAAQQLAQEQHRHAHLRILCLDSTRPLNSWERQRLADMDDRRLIALTKSDLPSQPNVPTPHVCTSARTGAGLKKLQTHLYDKAVALNQDGGEVVAATATRCRQSLRQAAEALQRARELTRQSAGEELAAAEVRLALEELGKVVGAVYTDDILDRIFSRFCIGK